MHNVPVADMEPIAAEAILACGYRGVVEAELQSAIEAAFTEHGVRFAREQSLTPRDRPDFLLRGNDGLLAIECKVDGAGAEVARQLGRYAAHPGVKAIILVTTRMRHAQQIPDFIDRVPITIVTLNNLP